MGNVCVYIFIIYYIIYIHTYIYRYLYPRDFHRNIYVDIPSGDQTWFLFEVLSVR